MALYAFDGTWNIRDGGGVVDFIENEDKRRMAPFRDTVETNVHRMYEYYGGKENAEYLQGVGTRFGPIGRVFGGAFGIGGRYRIRRMYRALCRRYFAGDHRIDLVGFSRGAAQAVHFANMLHKYGVRNPRRRHFAWWYYPGFGWTFRHPRSTEDDVAAPPIGFVGLFDTVATFGWPIGPTRNVTRVWEVEELPANVERAFHAMALDEIRRTFELVHPGIQPKEGFTDKQRQAHFYQVWFRGAHANIGGGYIDRGLSDIALAWMMEQAIWTWQRAKVPVPTGFLEALQALEPGQAAGSKAFLGTGREALRLNPDGSIGRPRKVPRKPTWRDVPPTPWLHYTAVLRTPNLAGDHYNLNRSLLRPVPGDRALRYDPPWLYRDTEQAHAEDLAVELFGSIPVRPSWLRVGNGNADLVFRGDNWIAQGTSQGRTKESVVAGLDRESFLAIAELWLREGGKLKPDDNRLMSLDLVAAFRLETPAQAATWAIAVLDRLLGVLPRTPNVDYLLRRFEPGGVEGSL